MVTFKKLSNNDQLKSALFRPQVCDIPSSFGLCYVNACHGHMQSSAWLSTHLTNRTKALTGQQHLDDERHCTNDWHFVSLVCELYGTEWYWNAADFNLMLLLKSQHCLRIIFMLSLNLHFIHHRWYYFNEQKQQVNTYSTVVIAITILDSSASSTAPGCGQHHQHELTGPLDHPASQQ
jgi:hypothetical protein